MSGIRASKPYTIPYTDRAGVMLAITPRVLRHWKDILKDGEIPGSEMFGPEFFRVSVDDMTPLIHPDELDDLSAAVAETMASDLLEFSGLGDKLSARFRGRGGEAGGDDAAPDREVVRGEAVGD